MLDGLGMAETTPGPLIMVTQFVGFLAAWREPGAMPPLLAATLGGLLTTWVTFTPCFLWIFFGAPFVEALRSNKALGAALGAITAAVVGVILNLAVWFGLHVLFARIVPTHFLGASVGVPVLSSVDVPSLVLAIAAAIAIFRFNYAGMIAVLRSAQCARRHDLLALRLDSGCRKGRVSRLARGAAVMTADWLESVVPTEEAALSRHESGSA